jgi:multiple sugar transport system substrate-binding protein
VGATLLLVLLLAGCTSERQARSDAGGLVYWTSPNPQELAMAQALVAEWNALRPDAPVTVQPIPAGQSSEEVIMAAVAGGTTPDVCSNIWPGLVADLVRAGGVLALDTLAGFDALAAERLPEGTLEAFQSADGHLYQMPWKTNPILMLYNRDLLAQAGYDHPPATYSAFLDAARKIQDLPGEAWIGYRDVRPIWWQRYFDFYSFYIGASGGRTLFEGDEVAVDTAAAREVMALFQTLYGEGFFPLSTFPGSPFLAGRIATEFTGPWSAAFLAENAPDSLRYDYAPLPTPDDHTGPVHTYGDFKNIAIFSTTQRSQEAWEFVQFLVSRQADLRLLAEAQQIPVRRGLLEDSLFAPAFNRNPYLRTFAEAAPHARGVDAVRTFQEALDAVAQGFERAVYRAETPSEAVASTLDRMRTIQEWSQ